MKEKYIDICIIGAGASGLAAAITAASQKGISTKESSILVIEKKDGPGKKIIASGNGRCNLSNANLPSWKDTSKFFESLGVVTMEESEGRLYPYSEDSKDVVRALENKCQELGVNFEFSTCVESVEKQGNRFIVKTNKSIVTCKKLLIASGGKAAPKLGTIGDGYTFAKNLGHKVTKLVPVLTAIEANPRPEALKLHGVRAKAEAKLTYKNKELFAEKGEVQFIKDGLSGICIFNMSRHLLVPEGKTYKDGFTDYKIYLDFAPLMTEEELAKHFENLGEMPLCDKLNSLVKRPLALYLAEGTNSDLALARKLKNTEFQPTGAKGWDFAQVTKGGVSLDEINKETMESLIVKNLYFSGEVLDYDGPCGGYNLENAWSSGIKCGKGMTL